MKFLSREEIRVLGLLEEAGFDIRSAERRSGRSYDLSLAGTQPGLKPEDRWGFTAWLPLLLVREFVAWPHPRVAELTQHPEMVREGDWSGVRDSESEDIFRILALAVDGSLPLASRAVAEKLAPRTYGVVAYEPKRRLRSGLTRAEAREELERNAAGDWGAVSAGIVEETP